jgi:quinol monooxygenase YgiN
MMVQYKIKKKKLAKVKDSLSEYADAVKTNEPGIIEYRIFQDGDDSSSFVHLISFIDKNAMKIHEKTEHWKKLEKILVPIAKGKAVYTTLMEVNSMKSQDNNEENTVVSSPEPI